MELFGVLTQLAGTLNELEIDFVVGGAVASAAWGEPRSTYDIDILIRLPESRVIDLTSSLSGTFHVDEHSVREATRNARSFNLIHLGIFQKIDVFVAGTSRLDEAQLESRVLRPLEPNSLQEFPVTSAEVMILRKLDWYRRGDMSSERQWRDILAMLRVQGRRLDFTKMADLASETGLTELLGRACRECFGERGRPSASR